jgi:predicted Zn-dependent protease
MPAGEMPPGGASGGAPALPSNPEERYTLMKQAADKFPDNFIHQVMLANEAYDVGRWADAVTYYRKALALQPDSNGVHVDLAFSLHKSGDSQGALKELRTVLARTPHHMQGLYVRGVVERALGHSAAAQQAWSDFLKYHPDEPHAPDIRAAIAAGTAGVLPDSPHGTAVAPSMDTRPGSGR